MHLLLIAFTKPLPNFILCLCLTFIRIMHLFKEIASEANKLLNDLQNSLYSQEDKLIAYAQQQREAHSRSVATTRSISQITVNFFKTLDMHAYNLNQLVEEAQTVNDQKLSELEKKFEECAANEERRLLEKVAELLESSNSRKNKLVQAAVIDLRESAASRTGRLQQEMSTMQDSTSSVKVEWSSYINKVEAHYLEDSATVDSGKKDLGGMDANQILRSRFSFVVSSTLEDADIISKNLLCSIDHSLQLDHDACGNLDSMIIPCCGDLRELKSGHYHKTVEITEDAGKCLLTEYVKTASTTCLTILGIKFSCYVYGRQGTKL